MHHKSRVPTGRGSLIKEVKTMKETYQCLGRSGAASLTLGVLTLIFGVTVGVLNIVNGGKLLHQRRALK